MSKLTEFEKSNLEEIFKMSGGYVLDFTDNSFKNFILRKTKIDIYDDRYRYRSGSKANRLRSFWNKETDYIVGDLTIQLLKYWKDEFIGSDEYFNDKKELYEECMKIAMRIKYETYSEDVPSIWERDFNYKDFRKLSESIKLDIENDKPEDALDRLHTYFIKYIKEICKNHDISIEGSNPLNKGYKNYVTYLGENNHIDTEMTRIILRNVRSLLNQFNHIRNDKTYAHDNKILNKEECVLIINTLSSIIKFIDNIEEKIR